MRLRSCRFRASRDAERFIANNESPPPCARRHFKPPSPPRGRIIAAHRPEAGCEELAGDDEELHKTLGGRDDGLGLADDQSDLLDRDIGILFQQLVFDVLALNVGPCGRRDVFGHTGATHTMADLAAFFA